MKTFTILMISFCIATFVMNAQEKPSSINFGTSFPEFKMVSNDGKEISLTDFKGEKSTSCFSTWKSVG
jgi:hypothetical protein